MCRWWAGLGGGEIRTKANEEDVVWLVKLNMLMVKLNMLNADLSPKRYWWGPRSHEVGEDGDYA